MEVRLLRITTWLGARPAELSHAWALADLSRSLGAIGKRLEGVVDSQALRPGWDITEVLDPPVTERSAD